MKLNTGIIGGKNANLSWKISKRNSVTVRLDSINKISGESNLNEFGEGDVLINKIVNAINGYSSYIAKELPFISRKEDNFWYTAKLFERNNYTLLLILDQFEELQGYN